MINFEIQIVKRQFVERREFVISTFSFIFIWKLFVMKSINATFDQYENENYKRWKKHCKQMKNVSQIC